MKSYTSNPQLQSDTLQDEFEALKVQVLKAYEQGVTVEDAERFAAKCLGAQMKLAEDLELSDLDARMRKNGLKAVKAAIWHDAATSGDKKPSDKALDAIVDMNKLVQDEQNAFDRADAHKDSLEVYLNIFRESHIYFRNIGRNS